MKRRTPTSTPFPYTTLFRSKAEAGEEGRSKVTGPSFSSPVYGGGAERSEAEGGGRAQPSAKPLPPPSRRLDRKSTRLNSSHVSISYAVFCLKKKKNINAQSG